MPRSSGCCKAARAKDAFRIATWATSMIEAVVTTRLSSKLVKE